MTRCVVRLAPALAVLLFLPCVPALARDGWHGADRPGARALFYGELPPEGQPPNPETIELLLRCADKGKAIVVFVAETSAKLKPGQKLRVTLSVRRAQSTATGHTMANQLAGVPSLRVTFPLNARVFAAMTEPLVLKIRAGGWQRLVGLVGLGDRMHRLLTSCRK